MYFEAKLTKHFFFITTFGQICQITTKLNSDFCKVKLSKKGKLFLHKKLILGGISKTRRLTKKFFAFF